MSRSYPPAYRCTLSFLLLLPLFLSSLAVSADDLLSLMTQRLNHMKGVAAYKWQHKLPIENLEREDLVLASAMQQSLRFNLDIASSRYFFEQQINAAKEVQRYWFTQWKAYPDTLPVNTADLNHEIRPALIGLGERISSKLADQHLNLAPLEVEGLSKTTAAALIEAAKTVSTYPNRLAQILDSGVLRVGTTGDYAPFSYRPEQNSTSQDWTGIDIDLAQDLARSLGVKVQWVPTTWPKLMNDLKKGQYDIGMSGISISLARQRSAFFSRPYHRGGKTALARCADSEKYSSLSAIDKPQTRLIVNPGGTNQKFVNSHIHQANIRVHNDNRSIFNELVKHTADVTITDQIEVQLQTARHPELCAAMKEKTLTFSEKAFLLPQDTVWKNYVDTWLGMRLGEEYVQEIIKTQLNTQVGS